MKKGYMIWFETNEDGFSEEHRKVKRDALDSGRSMRECLLSGMYSGGFESPVPVAPSQVTTKIYDKVTGEQIGGDFMPQSADDDNVAEDVPEEDDAHKYF